MKYEVTFRKDRDYPTPTDFFHLPAGLELIDMTIVHNTTRSEKWVYEIPTFEGAQFAEHNAKQCGAFEYAAQNCKTAIHFRQIADREYYVVSTYGSGWFILAGPFNSRSAAVSSDAMGCRSTDIYDETAYKNATVVTWNQIARLRTGLPPTRIGDEGRWQMWQEYRERQETGKE